MINCLQIQELQQALKTITEYVGTEFSDDLVTINGRLNNLQSAPQYEAPAIPFCETVQLFDTNKFKVTREPIHLGGAWVVNDTVKLMLRTGTSFDDPSVFMDWHMVSFEGTTGSLDGLKTNDLKDYHNVKVIVTYFTAASRLYPTLVFFDGAPTVASIGKEPFDLVLQDENDGKFYRFYIFNGMPIGPVLVEAAEEKGNPIITDISNGFSYKICCHNGEAYYKAL